MSWWLGSVCCWTFLADRTRVAYTSALFRPWHAGQWLLLLTPLNCTFHSSFRTGSTEGGSKQLEVRAFILIENQGCVSSTWHCFSWAMLVCHTDEDLFDCADCSYNTVSSFVISGDIGRDQLMESDDHMWISPPFCFLKVSSWQENEGGLAAWQRLKHLKGHFVKSCYFFDAWLLMVESSGMAIFI